MEFSQLEPLRPAPSQVLEIHQVSWPHTKEKSSFKLVPENKTNKSNKKTNPMHKWESRAQLKVCGFTNCVRSGRRDGSDEAVARRAERRGDVMVSSRPNPSETHQEATCSPLSPDKYVNVFILVSLCLPLPDGNLCSQTFPPSSSRWLNYRLHLPNQISRKVWVRLWKRHMTRPIIPLRAEFLFPRCREGAANKPVLTSSMEPNFKDGRFHFQDGRLASSKTVNYDSFSLVSPNKTTCLFNLDVENDEHVQKFILRGKKPFLAPTTDLKR